MRVADLRETVEKFIVERNETKRKRVSERVLPEDLTGQLWASCKTEYETLGAHLAGLQGELETTNAAIEAARKKVMAACLPIQAKPITKRGSIFAPETWLMQPAGETGAAMLGKDALEIKKKELFPLLVKQRHLIRDIFAVETDRYELEKIADFATRGDIAVIHHLSDKWRNRLEVGSALTGKLPKAVRHIWDDTVYTDAFGEPLPPEALKDGMPDMPPAGAPA